MIASPQRCYRFSTSDQWKAGLFERVDASIFDNADKLVPITAYALPARLIAAPGAAAPAAAPDGEALWRDQHGQLYRLAAGDDAPITLPAPSAIAQTVRIAVTRTSLWVAAVVPGSLQCFDREHLTSRFVVALPYPRVIDVASDGMDGVWALSGSGSTWHCVHVDCAGVMRADFVLQETPRPLQLTFLRRFDRIVVLVDKSPELSWFAPCDGRANLRIGLSSVRPCFAVTALGSDQQSRVLVAGTDGAPFGGAAQVVCLDGDGNPLGDIALPAPATGVNATTDALLVTTAQGLLRFAAAGSLPTVSTETSCTFITPALQSPLNAEPRRWLRLEALANLPRGTALQVLYATTSDPQARDEAVRIANDASLPATRRVSQLRGYLGEWRAAVSLPGSDAQEAASSVPLSAPLFDVRDPYLWISVSLVAAPGARLPELRELRVLYPGRTLMEHLPAIYQRLEAEPGNFLRALVGVLESSTQALDARIASLGSLIDPETAQAPWLDYVARWIGLPWDDALDESQKRALVKRANEITSKRGTRAGLEVLLDCLMPGQPPRYRVIDFTSEYGFATVGGTTCRGTTLPSVLAGLPSSGLALGRKAFLGRARLPCAANPDDGVSRLVGQLAIHVRATARERRDWSPWLGTLVAAVVPAMARVHLRWLSTAARLWSDRLDETLSLEDAPSPHLGTDAVIGLARLPAARGSTLTQTGLDLGTRLQ